MGTPSTETLPPGVSLTVPLDGRAAEGLAYPAGEFLDGLHRRFRPRRAGPWACAEAPPPLLDRRVEITGPTDAKMTINALNSGAQVWLADFEDANTPLWDHMVSGQLNLRDAFDDRLRFESPEGKVYEM